MVQNPAVSGLVRQQLEALGWTDDDPIPANLSQLFQSIKTSAIEQLRRECEAAATKEESDRLLAMLRKLEDDTFFRVENLPPEFVLAAQQQLFLAIADAKEQLEASQKLAEIESQLPPQIQGEERAKIVDRLVNRATESETPEESAPADPTPESVSVMTPHPEFCPCCAWKLSDKYEVKVTDEDKAAYVAAVMGNTRFHKTYPLFNEKGSVTFRTLLTTESDAIRFYLFEQSALGKITNDTMYIASWVAANAMLSLESVYYDGKATVYSATYQSYAAARGNILEAAGLEEYLQNIRELVSQETLRSLVLSQYNKFEGLVEQLKLRAADPDFYSGI